MAVVHYKFKNSVDYDSLTFDGLSISLKDLKLGIMKKKKMRAEDNDLQVVNAQTGEVYSSPSLMIPKNTSLIIARIPVGGTRRTKDDSAQAKAQKWAAFRKETQAAISAAETGGFNTEKIKQSSDLVNAQSSEIEKIAEMMKQSTKDFDPSNYTYKFPTGVPNPSYICRKCGKGGHYIQNCTNEPLEGANSPSDFPRMKRPTGIPVDSMVFVNEPLPGTYQTHSGKYAVPKIDVAAYVEGKKERPPFLPETEKKQVALKKPIPKELKCPLCGDLAKDAVVIPCCGISYCDECIRNKLLETEDHVCPSCDSMDVSPDGLIANQMLRRAVTNFQNETGYVNIKQAQLKAVEAAKAAAAATQVLKMQGSVVPRGPSVLDYKPPPRPPTPPPSQPAPAVVQNQPPVSAATSVSSQMKVNITPQKSFAPTLSEQEPPTPTQDEPIRSNSYTQHQHMSSSASQNISSGEPLQTVLGQTVQPVNRPQRRPVGPSGYDPYYKPSMSTSVPPPSVPPYPPPSAFPPPGVPPPFVGPPVIPLVRPPIIPPVVPPGFPTAIPPIPTVAAPPISMPKPLSKTEFLEEKNRILREELDRKEKDPLLEFAKKLEQRKVRSVKSRSRSRSPRPRSRSLSRPRFRSRSRGRSFSRSPRRSYTPRRSSLSPRRSYSPRRYSPRRSRSPRYSPRRYYSPRRSRSPPRRSISPRPRYRSYSRSPIRRRSFSRSRSRDRRRSPFRRSLSRSPLGRRSPFRRSYSRGRYTPPRSLSPYRRSPLRRSRSRGRSPIDKFRRSRSPLRFSPKRKRSPLRRSKSPFNRSPIRRSKSPMKRSPDRRMKDKPLPRAKSPKPARDTKKRAVPDKSKDKGRKDSETSISDSVNKVNNDKQIKSIEPNKENIPSKPVHSRSNNILINIVDSTTTDDNSEVESRNLKADSNHNENAVSNKSLDKIEKSAVESKASKESKDSGESESKQAPKEKAESKLKSRSRSKSKEKSTQPSRQSKPKKKRSPKRKEKSVSLSPERVKSPLRMPYRDRFDAGRGERFDTGRADRFESGRGRMEAGRDRFEGGRGGYGRDWDRNRDADPYFRARQNVGFRGRDFRGRGRGSDFRGGIGDYRGQQPPDYRNDYRPPPQQAPPGDFGPYPPLPDPAAMAGPYSRDFPQRGSSGFPANYGPNFPYPPRDPREDPNWQGLVRDEDVVKFEQYKQLYDFYSNSRTYGFPPAAVTSSAPSGQTPPQGPPPAPPGTTPILSPPERGGSPGRRRSISPRRHRSRSPRRDGKDRRERERDHRDKRSPAERRKDDREERSPNHKRDYSPEKKFTTDDSRDETSPEKKSKDSEKEARKEKKAKKKKEKAEGVEKKKKKKKDKEKTKTKKDKAEKKLKKLKMSEQSDNEDEVPRKSKLTESQNETDSDKSDSDTEMKVKGKTSRHNSTAQSDMSDNEKDESRKTEKTEKSIKIKKEPKEERESETKPRVKRSDSRKEEINTPEHVKIEVKSEVKSEDEINEPVKQGKRRSIKRVKPDADVEQASEAKKAKLEMAVKEEIKVEKMETSGGMSPTGSEGSDDIPQPEDELMLDPPELSKWEKDDDPYDLSPEPSKAKEKWKPGKQTFLPRSVIEKAEHALAQKVMKPTSVSSAVSVIQPAKKEGKSETKEVEPVQSKRDKSPVVEPKRRVFVEPDKKKDERRVATKQQHNVKITVTGDEKRKVATGNDLRNKLREKRKESEHPRDYDRSKDRDRDRSPERSKRKDSHSFRDRRSSRDYDRQDSRGSAKDSDRSRAAGRSMSRKESVIDDSRFVPDYDDDDSFTEDENSEDSSTDSSSDEEVVQRKHKHKKNKHKKEKKQKKKKEKKKKKHKLEKEKKVKSSVGK